MRCTATPSAPSSGRKEIHVPQTIEGAFAQGAKEMIVVLPDSKTVHNGSMYSSSVTTGDFEQFIARDVVAYIDAHYRTIPKRTSRGLVGHSMGGYGASRIGMKHLGRLRQPVHHEPVLSRRRGRPDRRTRRAKRRSKPSRRRPIRRSCRSGCARSWRRPPPGRRIRRTRRCTSTCRSKNGQVQPEVIAKWAANSPLAFVDQYIGNLKQYRGIAIDVGDQDGLRTGAGKLHEILDSYGVANTFEVYPGTHTSAVAVRFQNYVMPFFSKNLCAGSDCK